MKFLPDAWYSLTSIISTVLDRHSDRLNTLNEWATIVTVWGGLLGQSLFVAIYATRPWRQYRITRALMLKSIAFLLIFILSASRMVARGLRPSDDPTGFILFQMGVEAVILYAVWNQLFALISEIRRGGNGLHDDARVIRKL